MEMWTSRVKGTREMSSAQQRQAAHRASRGLITWEAKTSVMPRSIGLCSLMLFIATLYGCVQSGCPDDAVLYGKLNAELICYKGERIKHGKHIKYHKGGEIKAFERDYRDNLLDGAYKEWYSDGTLKVEVYYSQGMLNGSYKRWYANGNPQITARYSDNQRVGQYTEYFKNGRPRVQKNYNEYGTLEGFLTQFRPNGYKVRQERYEMGKLLERKYWRADGTPDPVLHGL